MSHAMKTLAANQIAFFRAFNDDGSAKTDLDAATTGLALSVFRVNEGAVSISSLSDKASDGAGHSDGAIRHVSGNLYTVDIPDAALDDQVPSIVVKGSFTGGVIEGTPHPVVGYDASLAAVGAANPTDVENKIFDAFFDETGGDINGLIDSIYDAIWEEGTPPTSTQIAAAVRTNLAAELARIDASVSGVPLLVDQQIANALDGTNVPQILADLIAADWISSDASPLAVASAVWNHVSRTLTSGHPTAVDIRSWIGLASANLDDQLSTIDETVNGIDQKTSDMTFTSNGQGTFLQVDLRAIEAVSIAETTDGRIAGNFSTFFDNADAATSQTVDDVGGSGGGNVTVGAFTQSALAEMVTTDTGETTAANGSVAKISQGAAGGNVTVGDITQSALAKLANTDTGETVAADGSVAKLSQATPSAIAAALGDDITVSQPVASNGQITSPIVIGDDYLATHGRAFEWTIASQTGVTAASASCKFGVKHCDKGSFIVDGTVTDNLDDTWTLSFDVTKTDTSSMAEGDYEWSVELLDSSGNEITRVRNNGDDYKVELVDKQT